MESNNILHKIVTTVVHYDLLDRNKNNRIVLALSGGPDSIFLLSVLFKLKKFFSMEIIPVHINHMIREEAYNEAVWLKNYIKDRFRVDVLIFSSNVLTLSKKWKKGIEETGRIVRKTVLNYIYNKFNADFITTGHNLDDQVETVIFRMIRGSGIKGISAMNPKDGIIIRPLLFVKKDEILHELEREKLLFINDITNADIRYTRNMIRHDLLPTMEKINNNVKTHIFDFAMDLSEINKYLEKTLSELIKKYVLMEHQEFHVYNANFLKEDKYIVSELLRNMYKRISGTNLYIERKHVFDFYFHALKKGAYSCFFPGKIFVSKSCDTVIFSKKMNFFQDFYVSVSNTANVLLPNGMGTLEVSFKTNKYNTDLQIRSFLPGDKYGGKKLKEYYLKKRIPNFFRKAIPLIAIGSDVLHNFLFDGEKKELMVEDCQVSFIFHPSELYCKIKHFLI